MANLYAFPQLPPNFDAVGIFYIAFCATWTSLLLGGIVFLCLHRHDPILKIRGLPLSLAAIVFLHLYWILSQLVYPIGQTMPIILAYDIQYFFMGIWFPLGIALFHASNSRFLYVAEQQKHFAYSDHPARLLNGNGVTNCWFYYLKCLPHPTKVLVYIGLGMVVQVLLTVGMWLACRKYHPTFGVPGTELRGTLEEQIIELGRGWEWWPSALWQVVWTWIVAPILLWRAWWIRDTLGWRFQTIGCCLSNLHATPMWLIATYTPAFQPVNKYFAPSQWIHLSVMMFEVFTVFVPCWLVLKQRRLGKKAAELNARWETASQTTTLKKSISLRRKSISVVEQGRAPVTDPSDVVLGDRLLTMDALDHALSDNPVPLQEFSALRDFSGENVAFLTRVASWKSSWPSGSHGISPGEDQVRAAFTRALQIYTDFISPRDAEFPINISSPDLKKLEAIFEQPARVVCGEARVNPATPFETDIPMGVIRKDSETTAGSLSQEEEEGESGSESGRIDIGEFADRIQYTGEISEEFGPAVFDAAETHVKYLVLTNTWPKFVSDMQHRRSDESKRSDSTAESHMTLMSKVSCAIRSFF